jgi:quinoprotein relay system zinc metallohydrolase 2
VRRGVHAEMSAANAGAIANIGFIIGDEAVAVIDSGGSFCDGEALRLAIRARTAKPVAHVINTHVHPDHIFGNAAFAPENAVFVGHAALPADMAARGDYYLRAFAETMGASLLTGTKIIAPTRLVEAETTLDLGGRRLTLRAHRPAHTSGDLTVYDETTRTLWAGDLVFLDHIPVLDGKLKGWLAVMNELAGVPAARVVPGHGPVSAPWPQALEPQRRYFEVLAADLRTHIATGGGMIGAADKAAAGEAARWELNGDYHIRNVNKALAELEWE